MVSIQEIIDLKAKVAEQAKELKEARHTGNSVDIELQASHQQVTALRKALEKYGQHRLGCPLVHLPSGFAICTCGFANALVAATSPPASEGAGTERHNVIKRFNRSEFRTTAQCSCGWHTVVSAALENADSELSKRVREHYKAPTNESGETGTICPCVRGGDPENICKVCWLSEKWGHDPDCATPGCVKGRIEEVTGD